jgi:hypothetical protein
MKMPNEYEKRSIELAKIMGWQIEPYIHKTAHWSTQDTRLVETMLGAHTEGTIVHPANAREFVRVVDQKGIVINSTPITARYYEDLDHEEYWALLPNFYVHEHMHLAIRTIAWGIKHEPLFKEWLIQEDHVLPIITHWYKNFGVMDALDMLLHQAKVSRDDIRADDL